MQILSIGNSFSQDAQRYLHDIARSDGVDLQAYNLYIGGCSLSRHYRNMLSRQPEYTLGVNGHATNFKVSLEDGLLNRDWDVVTLQQASPSSTDYETYQPYLAQLIDYVRRCVPKAKIAIHQTWAYEQDSHRLNVLMGYSHHADMFRDLQRAYDKAAQAVQADYVIPSGQVFEALLDAGIEKIHRDTYHASLGLGRYALGLTWYAVLTDRDIRENSFSDFDEAITPEQIEIVKQCVATVVKNHHT